MSFSKLLEKLLVGLINAMGPALIKLILDWLRGMNDDEVKEVAKNISDGIKKNLA